MRMKIIAGNLAAVVLLGVVSYLIVSSQIRSKLGGDVEVQISNDQVLFDRSWRLSQREFLDNVEERANDRAVRDVFAGLDEVSRRTRAYEAAEETSRWFANPARGREADPDIVAIIDDAGKVIARNASRNHMVGESLAQKLPSLQVVLRDGISQADAWRKVDDNKVLQIGLAPIRGEAGAILGALLVGYDISNGLAANEARILNRDVAFIVDGKVYSTSLPPEQVEPLNRFLSTSKSRLDAALTGGRTAKEPIQLGEDDYVGVLSRLPMAPALNIGYLILGSRSKATELANVAYQILLAMAVFALIVLVYGWVVGTSFERPIEKIEEGVLAVINGRTDLRLDIQSAELGGLAYRINQLLNVFTGVAEEQTPDEEEGGERPAGDAEAWTDAAFRDAAGGAGAGATPGSSDAVEDSQLAATLSNEPEDAYYQRIYNEYVAAKQTAGENVSNIPLDRFVQRLKNNEAALVQKHGCRMVRFQVESRGQQVILRPVIIR